MSTRFPQIFSMSSKKYLSPVVLCGPSGAGKSTLIKELQGKFPGLFGFSVSHTTRKPRPGEVNGVDYHFVSVNEMKRSLERDEFIEQAEFSGNFYGTSKRSVNDVLDLNKICLLDIDSQGVRKIKQTDLKPKLIFIQPPSMAELENRLRNRGTENEEKIQERLSYAQSEIEYGRTPEAFHIIIINDDVNKATEELEQFLLEDIKLAQKLQNA